MVNGTAAASQHPAFWQTVPAGIQETASSFADHLPDHNCNALCRVQEEVRQEIQKSPRIPITPERVPTFNRSPILHTPHGSAAALLVKPGHTSDFNHQREIHHQAAAAMMNKISKTKTLSKYHASIGLISGIDAWYRGSRLNAELQC